MAAASADGINTMRLLPALLAAPVLLTAVFFAAGCGEGAGAPPGAGQPLTGSVTIFAAASLTDVFNELATEFKRVHPSVDIRFNFAGSPTLRTQLEQGARGDLFASADIRQMDLARQSGVIVGGEKVFARNSLVVITPKSNPGKIASLIDLKKSGLKLVLANQDVPAGNYSREMLFNLEKDPANGVGYRDAVLKNVVSSESNVKQVVAKVELGEADAGIVYGTDVTSSLAGGLNRIEVPEQSNVVAQHAIALTKDAGNVRAAQAFVDFVLSAVGQAVLKKWGFLGAA